MARMIVTGGAGFIGSNLVERFVDEGHEVIVIDNLSTGSRNNVPPGVPIFTGKYKNILPLFRDGLGGVFHLGAPSNSLLYRGNRNLVASAINDFIDILEFVRGEGIRLVFVSSSSNYNGNPTPWREDMPIMAKDFYTETRYSWERLAKVYYDFYGVESVGLRLFSVYGPHEEAKGIYANLLTQLLWAKQRDEVFDIYGDGSQERDTVYVADTVEAFLLAMNNSGIKCDIFNVGTGKNYTLNEMAKMVGAKVRYVKNPMPNYVQATLADTTKAKKVLGFEAKYSLEGGLSLLCPTR